MVACEQCLTDCIEGQREDCAEMCRDCADICALTARLLARNSIFKADISALCAVFCGACATVCEQHALHDESCRNCAEACRQCATVCNVVATENFPETAEGESLNRFVIGGKQQCNPYEGQEGAPSAKTSEGSNSGRRTTDIPESGW
jgi:hypothetical protein